MKIVYATTFDANDVKKWSGTPYFMSNAFKKYGHDVNFVGNLPHKVSPFFPLKKMAKKLLGQRESPRFNIVAAKNYSISLAQRLNKQSFDVVVSPLINPIAYLETDKPIVLWTDAVYASLLGFYPPFAYHSANTIYEGNAITFSCLSRVKLAIFASTWAANAAKEIYGIREDKIKVVPFGANLIDAPPFELVKEKIAKRKSDTIKLLFLAKSWERKGGDTVLAVAKHLHNQGYPVELTIVGIKPPGFKKLPPYVHCLGFISKGTADGKARIEQLISDAHFLFVPSKGEAYGIVFCEANAYGVPCLTTHVGGIGTIIKPNINGMTFGLDATADEYCQYIVTLMHDEKRYQELALSSYNEFSTRLNWQKSIADVTKLIEGVK